MYQRIQQPIVDRAIKLFVNTQVSFADCQANGIKLDTEYLDGMISDTRKRMDDLEEEIWATDVGQRWKSMYGDEAALTKRRQLAEVLYGKTSPLSMGLKCTTFTKTGIPQVAEASLEKIPEISDFAKNYVLWLSLLKMLKTNLLGIREALDDNGFLHPSFSLFTVVSYRTSSSSGGGAGINFQNLPKRNEGLATIVRRCFIPRAKNRHIVELDYSGAEVRATASITGDPTLIGSVTKGIDFHKQTAAAAYKIPYDDVTKKLRQSVKGPFTFAAFYGSYWVSIAKNLWEQILYGGLETKDGVPLLEHLKKEGITELGNENNPRPGTYFWHIRKTEQWFWNDLFRVYSEWKRDNWEEYKEKGYLDLPTGFRCAGVFSRNNANNYIQQGSSAHCLLWSLNHISEIIREQGYDACLCGQIHDSIVMDVHTDCLDDVIRMAVSVMTEQLGKEMWWIQVPMEAEPDVAPAGESWLSAKAYELDS